MVLTFKDWRTCLRQYMKDEKVHVNFLFSSKQYLTHEALAWSPLNIHKTYTKTKPDLYKIYIK
jgi:hypothetical protein